MQRTQIWIISQHQQNFSLLNLTLVHLFSSLQLRFHSQVSSLTFCIFCILSLHPVYSGETSSPDHRQYLPLQMNEWTLNWRQTPNHADYWTSLVAQRVKNLPASDFLCLLPPAPICVSQPQPLALSLWASVSVPNLCLWMCLAVSTCPSAFVQELACASPCPPFLSLSPLKHKMFIVPRFVLR